MSEPPLIELVNVSKHYPRPNGQRAQHVLDRINLALPREQSIGLVGVSGAGKSTLARLILGLEPPSSGEIYFNGKQRCRKQRSDRHWLRRNIQMVWQDPLVYLNPYRTAGQTLAEALAVRGIRRSRRQARINDLFRMVTLSPDLQHRRPHEMSGGQAQRLSIARALALEPKILICDEILSGLDLPNQVKLITLLAGFQTRQGMALLFISHDLAPILKLCGHLVVLSKGRIVSRGATQTVLSCTDHETVRRLVHHYKQDVGGPFIGRSAG